MNIVHKTAVVFTLLVSAAHAAEFNTLRTEQSRVDFVYRQMNVPMEGSFKRFSGQLRFDPAKTTLAKAALDIDLASIDTGSTEGDEEVGASCGSTPSSSPSRALLPLRSSRSATTASRWQAR